MNLLEELNTTVTALVQRITTLESLHPGNSHPMANGFASRLDALEELHPANNHAGIFDHLATHDIVHSNLAQRLHALEQCHPGADHEKIGTLMADIGENTSERIDTVVDRVNQRFDSLNKAVHADRERVLNLLERVADIDDNPAKPTTTELQNRLGSLENQMISVHATFNRIEEEDATDEFDQLTGQQRINAGAIAELRSDLSECAFDKAHMWPRDPEHPSELLLDLIRSITTMATHQKIIAQRITAIGKKLDVTA